MLDIEGKKKSKIFYENIYFMLRNMHIYKKKKISEGLNKKI